MPDYHLNTKDYPPHWNYTENPISIEISAPINYSESETKVMIAIKNIFPNLELKKSSDNNIRGFSEDESILFTFCSKIFDQKILDVARKCVIEGIQKKVPQNDKNETIFFINKQIAFINKINFCAKNESPLGPITISITCKILDLVIDSFFPKFEWFTSKDN